MALRLAQSLADRLDGICLGVKASAGVSFRATHAGACYRAEYDYGRGKEKAARSDPGGTYAPFGTEHPIRGRSLS